MLEKTQGIFKGTFKKSSLFICSGCTSNCFKITLHNKFYLSLHQLFFKSSIIGPKLIEKKSKKDLEKKIRKNFHKKTQRFEKNLKLWMQLAS